MENKKVKKPSKYKSIPINFAIDNKDDMELYNFIKSRRAQTAFIKDLVADFKAKNLGTTTIIKSFEEEAEEQYEVEEEAIDIEENIEDTIEVVAVPGW